MEVFNLANEIRCLTFKFLGDTTFKTEGKVFLCKVVLVHQSNELKSRPGECNRDSEILRKT